MSRTRKKKGKNRVKSKRGQMLGRVNIFDRPAIAKDVRKAIADGKTEIGHRESDTMIGGNYLGVLVTHVDNTSNFLIAELVRNKIASEINRLFCAL